MTAKGYNVEVTDQQKAAAEGEARTAEATVADGGPDSSAAFTNDISARSLEVLQVTKVFSGLGDVKLTLKDFQITNNI